MGEVPGSPGAPAGAVGPVPAGRPNRSPPIPYTCRVSADPSGPTSSDATDPAPADGGPISSPKTARVKAGRAAAGPKRTPRPTEKAGGAPKAGPTAKPAATRRSTATVAAPAAVEAGDGRAATATTVVDRPAVEPPAEAPVDDTGTLPAAEADGAAARRKPARATRRGRRVKRVVRRIDLWSVLKLSLVVYTCLYLAVMATLAALWSLLYSTNTIEKVTDFLADVGMENFHFYGDQMFRACAAIGAVGVMAGTVITVLATALVNVISEITGGIRLVVIEEEPLH